VVRQLISKLLITPGSELEEDRISREIIFSAMARLISYRGTCNRGGRAGAIIAKDGRVVSIGYVGSPPGQDHCLTAGCIRSEETGGCVRTQHAEANSIAWAAREGISLKNATMYCTLSPCLSCAKLIVMAGIREVYYLDRYRIADGIDYLQDSGVRVLQIVLS